MVTIRRMMNSRPMALCIPITGHMTCVPVESSNNSAPAEGYYVACCCTSTACSTYQHLLIACNKSSETALLLQVLVGQMVENRMRHNGYAWCRRA